MTQHGSLRAPGSKRRQHRNVLKRFERINILKEKGRWKEGDSVFGLPKVKSIKIKAKKEKAPKPVAPPEAAEAEATPSPEDQNKGQ